MFDPNPAHCHRQRKVEKRQTLRNGELRKKTNNSEMTESEEKELHRKNYQKQEKN